MTITLYMFYVVDQHRPFLWNSEKRDDTTAIERAKKHLKSTLGTLGKLYMGPTGEDEMKFVKNVMLSDA